MTKVLVVDDDSNLRILLNTVLTRKGHEVFLAENGLEGMSIFQRERPGITVLDLNMPEMDGLAVLREIRTAEPGAAVIMLTGVATPAVEQEARMLGVTEFLQKGFSLQAFGEALRKILQQRMQAPVIADGSGA